MADDDARRQAPRRRLFAKYAVLIVTLVGGMLVASGAISIYVALRESRENLAALQQEKAQAAATRIEQYVLDIEHQLGWTALPATDASINPLEQRRIEFFKLLRLVPAITEAAWIDPAGREQLRVSRLAMDVVGAGTDVAAEPAFREASRGAVYTGPVYFRKETEPYMTIARADGGGVTAVEVNLKFVWEVVSRIHVGERGLAFVVDANGILIAHPDISLVLKKSDLRGLPQIAALGASSTKPASPLGRDLRGDEVFTASASIPSLRWTVFVESPRAEAFAPIYAQVARTVLLLVAGLVLAVLGALALARSMTRPISLLTRGARRIGQGRLDERIEVRTGDELESLADQFNRMTAQLRESYADLERKVEARTAELREALEQQTATAEVLQVISHSVADTRPVFDKILASCQKLFKGTRSAIQLVGDDGRIRLVAYEGPRSAAFEALFPMAVDASSGTGRAIVERRVLHCPDVANGADVPERVRSAGAAVGFEAALFAPMILDGRGIGSINVSRATSGPFAVSEIGLLKTFADQAVIAIENARLFNETKEALEQQTATAEILKVMSSSPTDVQPVFDAIAVHARTLCDAMVGGVALVDGESVRLAAYHGTSPEANAAMRAAYPRPLGRDSVMSRAIVESAPVQIADVLADPDYALKDAARQGGFRANLGVPMVRDGEVVGSIAVCREEPGPFPERLVTLLQTFADQAVIAIENVRLFNETREALERQTATAEVLQVISHSVSDTRPVFEKILESCQHLFQSDEQGIALIGDDDRIHLGAHRGRTRETLVKMFPLRMGDAGPVTSAVRERRVLHFADVVNDPDVPGVLRRIADLRGGAPYSQAMAPMVWEGRGIGVIYVTREPATGFGDKELGLLKTFADQATIAIQNARLFQEIQDKSRQLQLADKHKSEFLANMSHELRTPLNAIIGFSEVLAERMFGEVNDKQLEYLNDIHTSGHHLLSLINDILDLSKIEAGRMELDLTTVQLPMLLDNCMTLVRERASRQGLALSLDVEPGVGDWVADMRKVKQVVINLLSNAVKFTPAGGRVTLRARRLGDAVEIAVVDTGVGIAADQQALVFEEFRQAGGDYLRKNEGTGLGLTLAKRFVELHGGTIRVESAPGAGSTFAFVLPERVLEAV